MAGSGSGHSSGQSYGGSGGSSGGAPGSGPGGGTRRPAPLSVGGPGSGHHSGSQDAYGAHSLGGYAAAGRVRPLGGGSGSGHGSGHGSGTFGPATTAGRYSSGGGFEVVPSGETSAGSRGLSRSRRSLEGQGMDAAWGLGAVPPSPPQEMVRGGGG